MIDLRGPNRTIVYVDDRQPTATFLKLSCGHVATVNQIFHYTVGRESHCTQCIDQNDLPEYLRSAPVKS